MTIFTILATIIFLLLGIMWSKDGWLNFAIKTAFFAMFTHGVILTAVNLGYIVKI